MAFAAAAIILLSVPRTTSQTPTAPEPRSLPARTQPVPGTVSPDMHTLNAAPRGYTMQHPRIDLLRMKDIYAGRTIEPGAVLASRKAIAAVKKVMADVQPLGDWLAKYVSRA